MNRPKTTRAILNSIRWYETIFAAHGLTSMTDERVWHSYETPPPFHSNLVVLSPLTRQAKIEACISEIEKRLHPTSWSIKDSYAVLDLASLGFSMLFQADWIWRDPVLDTMPLLDSRLSWTKLTSPSSMAEWEDAWSGNTKNQFRQFPDSLFNRSDYAFFAGRLQGKIVAGGIANRSLGVVGLSNIFSPTDLLEDTWQALATSISINFPKTPIVGYERGTNLSIAKRAGFESIGKLRVWCRHSDKI
jgi:hypothetical protein